ncbi:MAG TPA: polyprenyl synthetase family protein [Candidatus Doudnabacteria bacterium]|nr:polyprenyl synthetase family protein [Candidatus Doudnabacteria bacterium]
MKDFYKNRAPLEKEIMRIISSAKVFSKSSHVWSKDAFDRLEEFVLAGKLIRGLLVVFAAEPKTKNQLMDAVKIGGMLEIMHTGILIHDDIMDRDQQRRGIPTVHTQYEKSLNSLDKNERLHYGESMASCVGIVAYFLAMNQFADIKNQKASAKLISLFSSEMAVLGLAQMDDVDSSINKRHINKKAILRIYEQKTGRYTFALPLMAGLILQNKLNSRTAKVVYQLAKSLGIIFQLKDDCLGVFGNSAQTGKSVGGDIREKKQTWLYFELLKKCSSVEAGLLRKLYNGHAAISNAQQAKVLDLLHRYKIEELANKEIVKHQKIVVKDIDKLPFSKLSKQGLIDLTEYLVTRQK